MKLSNWFDGVEATNKMHWRETELKEVREHILTKSWYQGSGGWDQTEMRTSSGTAEATIPLGRKEQKKEERWLRHRWWYRFRTGRVAHQGQSPSWRLQTAALNTQPRDFDAILMAPPRPCQQSRQPLFSVNNRAPSWCLARTTYVYYDRFYLYLTRFGKIHTTKFVCALLSALFSNTRCMLQQNFSPLL